MVKPYYIKGVHRVKKNICSQMFYKVVVLESFVKFTGKHLRWSHFLIKLHEDRHKESPSPVFSYEVFFLITPQNQTTLQRKQISKPT